MNIKKTLSFLLSVVMILSVILLAANAEEQASMPASDLVFDTEAVDESESDKNKDLGIGLVKALYKNDIIVDGTINESEWDETNNLTLKCGENMATWTTEFPGEIQFFYSWGENGFYIAAKVTDSTLALTEKKYDGMIPQDRLQLALNPCGLIYGDANGLLFTFFPTYEEGTDPATVTSGTVGARKHYWEENRENSQDVTWSGYNGAYTVTEDGWNMEVVLPWRLIATRNRVWDIIDYDTEGDFCSVFDPKSEDRTKAFAEASIAYFDGFNTGRTVSPDCDANDMSTLSYDITFKFYMDGENTDDETVTHYTIKELKDIFTDVDWYAWENSGKCGDNLTWTLDDEYTLTISGTGEIENAFDFSASYLIDTVIIEDGVTGICDGAFYKCSALTRIIVDENNEYYSNDEYGVLFNKDKTTLVTYPRNGSSSYIIPDSVTSICGNAFYNCQKLKSVEIPDGIIDIGDKAFYGCKKLSNITLPATVVTIGNRAFSGCSSVSVDENNEYYSNDEYGAIFNKDKTKLIAYPCGVGSSYVIPDGVTSIAEGAFENCFNIISVMIPGSVKTIDGFAFYGCSSLTSITIPDGVTSIDESMFYNCSNLKSISIPDSVTSIGDYAFYGCSSLSSITIPDNVTKIGYRAFMSCTSLTSITIPDSVTSIGKMAFYSCHNLKTVTFGDGITDIFSWTFYNCVNITDIYYTGTEEEWNQISIEVGNSSLLDATVHFNYVDADEPQVPTIPELKEESNYVIDESIGAIVAKPTSKGGESLNAFMDNIATDPTYVRVVDAEGVVRTEVTRLTTGYKIQLLDENGNVSSQYEIVLLGDTDSNGRYSLADVSGVQSAVIEKPAKGTIDFKVVDVDGNSRLSFSDASALQAFVTNGTW